MPDPDQYPSRLAEKIVVRLPDGMRDRLAEAARANKRSTNAEVVDRLERSFGGGTSGGESAPAVATLEVELGSDGMPISWGEIHEHLRALLKAGRLDIAQMRVFVLTPELVSSAEREKQAGELARHYRRLLSKRSGDSRAPGPATDVPVATDVVINKDGAKPARRKRG